MAATNQLSIKLRINTKTKKLCFAEASSDVVEFLTGLLSLPLGTVTSLLAKENMAGSVGNLLGSAEKLDANCNSKERQLSPAVTPATLSCLQELLGSHFSNGNCNGDSNGNSSNHFTCEGPEPSTYTSVRTSCGYLTPNYGNECPGCGEYMEKPTTIASAGTKGPVVVEAAPVTPRYTVKNDLSVKPASLSLITMLAECDVRDLGIFLNNFFSLITDLIR
ncbi:hypothetical protein ACQ4PT_002949 [Festuca glaucescens]